MSTPLRIGSEIGGTKQQLVAGDAEGNIIDRCRFSVDSGGGGPVIRERIAEELPALIATHKPERIGVGFGGQWAVLTRPFEVKTYTLVDLPEVQEPDLIFLA